MNLAIIISLLFDAWACQHIGLLSERSLTFSVQPEQIAQLFAQIPDSVDRNVAGKMRFVICGRDEQDHFTATVELS
jgi:hypothetical protein